LARLGNGNWLCNFYGFYCMARTDS